MDYNFRPIILRSRQLLEFGKVSFGHLKDRIEAWGGI